MSTKFFLWFLDGAEFTYSNPDTSFFRVLPPICAFLRQVGPDYSVLKVKMADHTQMTTNIQITTTNNCGLFKTWLIWFFSNREMFFYGSAFSKSRKHEVTAPYHPGGVYPALMVLFASVSIELPGERKLSVKTNKFDNVNQLRIISFITKVKSRNVQIRG